MPATITVATQSSTPASRASADFVGDGINDQNAINAALDSLVNGGCIYLCEGTYRIRSNGNVFKGGVVIKNSNVLLTGAGASTRLMLDANQNVNVIRIWGDNTRNVTIRDIYINGARDTNSTSNFETCGIRGSSVVPPNNPQCNITVDSCLIEECYSLNVFLWGTGVFVHNCRLGNASADIGELLGGPGAFTDNYVEVSATSGYGLGSDQASNIRISNNTVRVTSTGRITEAIFRTWGGRYRNVIDANQVYVEPGGIVRLFCEVNGYLNIISNNSISGQQATPELGIRRGGIYVNGGTVLSANLFQNIDFVGEDTSGGWPISLVNNYFFYSSIISKPNNTMMLGNVFYPK